MPHYKCAACRIRMRSAEPAPGEPCPSCGLPFEPVGELCEILGYRSVEAPERTAQAGAEEERWLDDGGFAPEPIAAAIALPAPGAAPPQVRS